MRRRRRSRGTWFPVLGTPQPVGNQEDEPYDIPGRVWEITYNPTLDDGKPVMELLDLTYDLPREGDDTSSLADQVGSEYFLKRIVGKFHAICTRDADNLDYDLLVGLGFLVARAGDERNQAANFPIGYESGLDPSTWRQYSPLASETIREPWIWRRTWVLSDRPVGNFHSFEPFPRTIAGYGSVLDGGHVDAKTKRVVSQDNRLWAALAVSPFPPGRSPEEIGPASLTLTGHLETRLFGSLRKAKQGGAF